MKYLLGLFLVLLASLGDAAELAPFTTDGCSAFPNGTPKNLQLWTQCCVRHDLAYWKGGTYQERVEADNALEQCVTTAGEPEIAKLMLQGVRAGGSPYFPTPYRWGYGWPFPRGYQSLTDDEWSQVATQVQALIAILQSVAITAPVTSAK